MSHYDTLGVPCDATAAQIKAAFRKLASKHHPDRGGDKEKSAAVNDAYACLFDSERRARYDAGGHDAPTMSAEQILAAQALQVIAKAIAAALDNPDIEQLGLIRTVRSDLSNACKQLDHKANDARNAAKKFERVKAKLRRKAKGGDDLAAMIVDGKIAEQMGMAANADGALKQVRAAIALIDDYESEPAPGPNFKPTMMNPFETLMMGGMGGFGGRF